VTARTRPVRRLVAWFEFQRQLYANNSLAGRDGL
jgi:hypothetical protein